MPHTSRLALALSLLAGCGSHGSESPPLYAPDSGAKDASLSLDGAGGGVDANLSVDAHASEGGSSDPGDGGGPPHPGSDAGPSATDAATADAGPPVFALGPEWTGPCTAATGAIDVNLGHTPESFVRAAYCQINGAEPPAATVTNWAAQLRTVSYVRRIDVVRTLCQAAAKSCPLAYSDPWLTHPPLDARCARKTTRDVGAVMMFFFGCPGGTNCKADWANTHAYGMAAPDPIYGSGTSDAGVYAPSNVGFWLRELLDARYAGLQFMMPNVYGFDIEPSTGQAQNLETALLAIDQLGGGMQVGLFNDTWAWGEAAGGPLMNPAPNLSNTEDAAQRIYAVEWKPFFSAVSKAHWYTVQGAPLIYFYNAGTLVPTSGSSAVIARMKQLFLADFGVSPFVMMDRGYGTVTSGDGQFVWDTFTNEPTTHLATSTGVTGGLTIQNSMVKWDSLGRDTPGAIASGSTRLAKGTDILTNVLASSSTANLLLLETWNDLGEGTGITRNYDYYVNGEFLPPDGFMSIVRGAQCAN